MRHICLRRLGTWRTLTSTRNRFPSSAASPYLSNFALKLVRRWFRNTADPPAVVKRSPCLSIRQWTGRELEEICDRVRVRQDVPTNSGLSKPTSTGKRRCWGNFSGNAEFCRTAQDGQPIQHARAERPEQSVRRRCGPLLTTCSHTFPTRMSQRPAEASLCKTSPMRDRVDHRGIENGYWTNDSAVGSDRCPAGLSGVCLTRRTFPAGESHARIEALPNRETVG